MMGAFKTFIRVILTKLFGKPFSSPALTKILTGSTMISFDVFDTLIIRPSLKTPSDLFDLLHPGDSAYKSRRIAAERQARDASHLEDIKLFDIYELLYDNPRERQEAINLEIATELSACKANPEALEFFKVVKQEGKRLIIVSDMYLDSSTIEEILKNCGYDLADVPIYVSSEYGKTKRSGNLFRTVLEHEEVEAGKVLHIGDNLISDYLMPKKCGMKSFLYRRA